MDALIEVRGGSIWACAIGAGGYSRTARGLLPRRTPTLIHAHTTAMSRRTTWPSDPELVATS
jgi:hypothetical protein